MKRLTILTVAAAASLALAMGCSKKDDTKKKPAAAKPNPEAKNPEAKKPEAKKPEAKKPAASKDIVDTAAAAGSFKTLLKAAEVAGLVDALKGKGPLTVFAPTDEAFKKLGDKTIAAVLKDKAKLAAILKHHVVAGKVMAKDAAGLKEAKMLGGKTLAIDSSDGVKIGDAKVVKADIVASNGVIHVIDTVLIPK